MCLARSLDLDLDLDLISATSIDIVHCAWVFGVANSTNLET